MGATPPPQGHAHRHGATPTNTGAHPPPWRHALATGPPPPGADSSCWTPGRACSPCPRAEAAEQGWTGWSPGNPLTLDVGPGGRTRSAGGYFHVLHVHICTRACDTQVKRRAPLPPGDANQHACHTPTAPKPHAALHLAPRGWWPWGREPAQAFPAEKDLLRLVPFPRVCAGLCSRANPRPPCQQQAPRLPRSLRYFIFYRNCLAGSIVVTQNLMITKAHPLSRKPLSLEHIHDP